VSNISIRGANSKQVQVLVDGMRVKSSTTGEADLSDISPDLIERIEVIRGPQSTLYGADAIGGVVNIITKRGKGPFSGAVEGGAGNYDTYTGRGWLTGSVLVLRLRRLHLTSRIERAIQERRLGQERRQPAPGRVAAVGQLDRVQPALGPEPDRRAREVPQHAGVRAAERPGHRQQRPSGTESLVMA
jgi:outer membrane receptor protein involved in Fe transport